MMNRVIGVGWDVGGWHGRNNAVVVLEWDDTTRKPALLGKGCKNLPPGVLALPEFVEHFCKKEAKAAVRSAIEDSEATVVVAVDAPLGYPTAFRDFVTNPGKWSGVIDPAARFVLNPLGFRQTDREIAALFPSKTPLSVSFDKLGNPASVAIRHTRHWAKGAGPIVQMTKPAPRELPHIIEVYPALAKATTSRQAAACSEYSGLMGDCSPGSHVYDAWLAAVLALGLAVGDDTFLPALKPTAFEADEGAIWYPTSSAWRLAR